MDFARIKDTSWSTYATRDHRAHPATADRRAGCSQSSSGGALGRPPGSATAKRWPTAITWRERPPDMAAWPAKPAASDVVAHATAQRVLATRARRVSPVEAAVNSTRNLREDLRDFSTLFHSGPGSLIGTADAARGAATKSGGWRSSETLSCQSKPMADEPASAKPDVASLSTPTTCKPRGRATSAAFCAAHETHIADVTDGAGA